MYCWGPQCSSFCLCVTVNWTEWFPLLKILKKKVIKSKINPYQIKRKRNVSIQFWQRSKLEPGSKVIVWLIKCGGQKKTSEDAHGELFWCSLHWFCVIYWQYCWIAIVTDFFFSENMVCIQFGPICPIRNVLTVMRTLFKTTKWKLPWKKRVLAALCYIYI